MPRTRWVLVKLALIGLASAAAAGLVSLMVTWWASPVDAALNLGSGNSNSGLTRLSPLLFGARGVVPLGYAAFAFALGVTVGLLVRRTLPAMAITLAIFIGVQVLMPTLVRPHLLPPATATAPINFATAELTISSGGPGTGGSIAVHGSYSKPGAWILSDQTITPAGRPFSPAAPAVCEQANPQPCNSWLTARHLRQAVSYQPASRFWPLQWLELGIYLILTLALSALCVWQVRRRRA